MAGLHTHERVSSFPISSLPVPGPSWYLYAEGGKICRPLRRMLPPVWRKLSPSVAEVAVIGMADSPMIVSNLGYCVLPYKKHKLIDDNDNSTIKLGWLPRVRILQFDSPTKQSSSIAPSSPSVPFPHHWRIESWCGALVAEAPDLLQRSNSLQSDEKQVGCACLYWSQECCTLGSSQSGILALGSGFLRTTTPQRCQNCEGP